jgi:hypothetical protein
VPAITPWRDGEPQFAATGVARTFLCAFERRCSICAGPMIPGPVWRVVGGEEADAIAGALADGVAFRNAAPTAEAPGHRTCMLYAAIVCPWLTRANARRGRDVTVASLAVTRGTARGHGGAVVGFHAFEFSYSRDLGVRFRFDGVVEFLPHETGTEHLDLLRVAVDEPAAGDAPPYLLADEESANRVFAAYIDQLS